MIVGLGVDAVEIKRFNHWHTYSHKQLKRVFSEEEISYCLTIPAKSAERFAVRMAAKEAFFKALSTTYPDVSIPFLSLCPLVAVFKKANKSPYLSINWVEIQGKNSSIQALHSMLSLTHTTCTAIATVLLKKN